MTESARRDFKGMGHFEAKLSFQRLRFAPISIDRSIGKWLYYTLPVNVFKQRNFVADVIRLNLKFIFLNKKSLLEQPFRVASKYRQCIVWYCHKARVCQTRRRTDRRTNRQTDGHNYDPEDRCSIATSRVASGINLP